MANLSDEAIEQVAAMPRNDPKRLRQQIRGLCARCEEPYRGKRTVICEFAPYAGMRLDAECLAALLAETIEDDDGEET